MGGRKAWWLAAGVALLAAALWLQRGAPESAPAVKVAAPAVAPVTPPASPWCRAGGQRRYAITHQSQAYASVAAEEGPTTQRPPGVEAQTTLDGVLVARCLEGAELGQVRVGFLLASLDAARVMALDHAVLTAEERALLLSTEMLLDLQPDGTLARMRFSEPTSEMVRNLWQLLWSDIQVRLTEADVYQSLDETVQGRVFSNYAQRAVGRTRAVERERDHYDLLRAAEAYGHPLPYSLAGHAQGVVEGGLLVSLNSEETLTVMGAKGAPHQESHAVTTLRLLASETAATQPPARVGAPVVVGQLAARPDFEARMLEMRVDGLTMEQMKELLLKFANGGQLPDHNRFLWRATGLLRAHPELLAQMEALFQDAALNSRGRQLVLDLLVGTGTPQAQASLRSVLASSTAQRDPNYGLFYQRLGLVGAPDEKTVLTAAEHYRAPGAEGRPAAIYAYGAVLGNRLAQGDAAAKGMANGILEDLKHAVDTQDKTLLLMALGNAGVPEQAEEIVAFTASSDALVRRAAANALRKDKDPQVTAVLLGMVGDVDTDVQRRALMSLEGRVLEPSAWDAMTAVVRSGKLGEATYELLLDVVSAAVHLPEARQTLEAVLEVQPPPSVHVMGRAREMLAIYQTIPSEPTPEDLEEAPDLP